MEIWQTPTYDPPSALRGCYMEKNDDVGATPVLESSQGKDWPDACRVCFSELRDIGLRKGPRPRAVDRYLPFRCTYCVVGGPNRNWNRVVGGPELY